MTRFWRSALDVAFLTGASLGLMALNEKCSSRDAVEHAALESEARTSDQKSFVKAWPSAHGEQLIRAFEERESLSEEGKRILDSHCLERDSALTASSILDKECAANPTVALRHGRDPIDEATVAQWRRVYENPRKQREREEFCKPFNVTVFGYVLASFQRDGCP